jgi:hypothetical protein
MCVRQRELLWVAALLLLPSQASADAIVVSRAMFASTIAEFFIEEERVVVSLEIGGTDLEAFRNLLPDELYEQAGHAPLAWAERQQRFFREDFPIVADGGAPLRARILEMRTRPRLSRDEITGEPLPIGEEPPETVLFARLEYALPGRPERLTFSAPRGPAPASVGFVAYHRAVAVNDFRYLAAQQTLALDWDDPWYSAFESRSLRRRYFAPMSGFLYVEPYEVRKEIIARPRDLQHWVDLGLEGRQTIPAEAQPELRRRAAEFLRGHQHVLIDGREIEPELLRVNFLERSLRSSRVVDPPVELDVDSAMLGVIFVYPVDGLPDVVTLDWDLWSERMQQIPVAAVDQAGSLPGTLEPDWRVLEWRNFLKNPELPTLRVIANPPPRAARWAWNLRWLALTALVAAGIWLWRSTRRAGARSVPARAVAAAAVLAVVLCFGWGRSAQLSDARSNEIVSGLLHNVYRAFDFREEERIYDVLAQSVTGDLLARIYLETRRGLELASQGGARAKVKELAMIELEATPADGGGFVATATWNVGGSVGHWGHVHQRRNQYRAELGVAPVEGVWKLVDLEVLEEERL